MVLIYLHVVKNKMQKYVSGNCIFCKLVSEFIPKVQHNRGISNRLVFPHTITHEQPLPVSTIISF